jgi:hypothetical protein
MVGLPFDNAVSIEMELASRDEKDGAPEKSLVARKRAVPMETALMESSAPEGGGGEDVVDIIGCMGCVGALESSEDLLT